MRRTKASSLILTFVFAVASTQAQQTVTGPRGGKATATVSTKGNTATASGTATGARGNTASAQGTEALTGQTEVTLMQPCCSGAFL
jgi:hypothetical protein